MEFHGTVNGPAMTSMRERFARRVSDHPDEFVIEFSRGAMADDLCGDEKAVFLEVLAFLAGITDFHCSSDPGTRLENESTFLPALARDGLLRSLSRFHTAAREVARDWRADHGELSNVIAHQGIGARSASIDRARHTISENGKFSQEERRFRMWGFSVRRFRVKRFRKTVSNEPRWLCSRLARKGFVLKCFF